MRLTGAMGDGAIVEILRLLSKAPTNTAFKLRMYHHEPSGDVDYGLRAIAEGRYKSLAPRLPVVSRAVVDRDISYFYRSWFRSLSIIPVSGLCSRDSSQNRPNGAATAVLVRKAARLFLYAATVCRHDFVQQNLSKKPPRPAEE